ncbi:MAG: hypothetical protein LBD42_09600 [Desulfovibrio sp.]|jgi:hypothetical protein|nr:hypothetical protein [Desulfovibrio sp.]
MSKTAAKATQQAQSLVHLTQEIEHLRWTVDSLTRRNEILETLNASYEERLSLHRQLGHISSAPKDAEPPPAWANSIEGPIQ